MNVPLNTMLTTTMNPDCLDCMTPHVRLIDVETLDTSILEFGKRLPVPTTSRHDHSHDHDHDPDHDTVTRSPSSSSLTLLPRPPARHRGVSHAQITMRLLNFPPQGGMSLWAVRQGSVVMSHHRWPGRLVAIDKG